MTQSTLSLGQRVVLLARMAVEEHLRQSFEADLKGQIGGADREWFSAPEKSVAAPLASAVDEGEIE